jgi:hypothetical protein
VKLRKVAVAIAAASALCLGAMLPAHADPVLYTDGGNGTRTVRVPHPDHPEWSVSVKVDVVFGFRPGSDAGPEFASPYAEVGDGPGALRWQINNPRLRVDQTSASIAPVGPFSIYVNDYFPSPVANPRNNTPTGAGTPENDACTAQNDGTFYGIYPLPRGTGGRLYDERAPKDGQCEDASQLVPNPLNSASDYSPDASVVRARGDWTDIGDSASSSGHAAVRVFFIVRWNNGDLTYHSVGSNFAAYGA